MLQVVRKTLVVDGLRGNNDYEVAHRAGKVHKRNPDTADLVPVQANTGAIWQPPPGLLMVPSLVNRAGFKPFLHVAAIVHFIFFNSKTKLRCENKTKNA